MICWDPSKPQSSPAVEEGWAYPEAVGPIRAETQPSQCLSPREALSPAKRRTQRKKSQTGLQREGLGGGTHLEVSQRLGPGRREHTLVTAIRAGARTCITPGRCQLDAVFRDTQKFRT